MLPRHVQHVDFLDDRVVIHGTDWSHPIVERHNGLVEYEPGNYYKVCMFERNGMELYVDFFQLRLSRAFVDGEQWVLSYQPDGRGVEFFGENGQKRMKDEATECKILNYALDYMTLPLHVLKCLQTIWFLLSEDHESFQFHTAMMRTVLFEDEFDAIGIPTCDMRKMPFDALRSRLDSIHLACKLASTSHRSALQTRRDLSLSIVFGWTVLELVLSDARARNEPAHDAYYGALVRDISEYIRDWERVLGLRHRDKNGCGAWWLIEKARARALDAAATSLSAHHEASFDSLLSELKGDDRGRDDRATKRSARRRRQKEHRRDSKETHSKNAATKREEAHVAAERRLKDAATTAVERAIEIAVSLADGGDKAGAARRLGESLAKHHAACGKDVRKRAVARRAEWTARAPIEDELLCPITLEELRDPVVLAGDGRMYERHAIETWLKKSRMSPMTGMELVDVSLTANDAARAAVLARRSP